jgi:ABC-2 type transport system permease protein
MAVIAAILRAQLLSIRNMYGRSRRGGMAISALALAMWFGMWGLVAYAAYALARTSDVHALQAALPRALLGIALYWQLSPMVSASLGASLDLRKLLVYPIPHSRLFLIEVLLRLSTGLEMLLVMAAGFTGLVMNAAVAPGWMGAARMSAVLGVFVLFNLLLAAGTRSLLERALAKRRVREFVVLAMVILVAAPRVLVESGLSWERLAWLLQGSGDAWSPWGAAARLLLGERLPLVPLGA